MTDRALELDDIQGDILGGFNTDVQTLLGLSPSSSAAVPKAATWLASLAPEVTSAATVIGQREAMKATPTDPNLSWLAIALSRTFLRSAAPDVFVLDNAFNDGMASRAASALGDRSKPGDWEAGSPIKPLDVLLKIAANDERTVQRRADALAAAAIANGFTVTYRETGRRLMNEAEHFGFKDGISQPEVLGNGSTTGLSPGRFIFGYQRNPGGAPPKLAIDDRKLTDNGSLLAFRRLVQDVRAFRTFTVGAAGGLQARWPGLSPDHLAALVVGRWPSGAPAHVLDAADPGTTDPDNGFDFHGDDDGRTCPFGAHIRKVNPRKGKSDVVDVPRLLRRGIPFGPPYDDDPNAKRGLLFLSYQASLTGTFEFITGHWMNSHSSPGTGDDLLIGRPFDSREMPMAGPSGEVSVSTGGAQWIAPTGGAYLFAPGKAGLARLGDPVPMLATLAAPLLFARLTTTVRQIAGIR